MTESSRPLAGIGNDKETMDACVGKVDGWLYDITLRPLTRAPDEFDRLFQPPLSRR